MPSVMTSPSRGSPSNRCQEQPLFSADGAHSALQRHSERDSMVDSWADLQKCFFSSLHSNAKLATFVAMSWLFSMFHANTHSFCLQVLRGIRLVSLWCKLCITPSKYTETPRKLRLRNTPFCVQGSVSVWSWITFTHRPLPLSLYRGAQAKMKK